MWWILILTMMTTNGVEVSIVEDIKDEKLCKIAGEQWLKSVPDHFTVRKYYVCARRT